MSTRDRRSFLRTSALLAGGITLSGCSPDSAPPHSERTPSSLSPPPESDDPSVIADAIEARVRLKGNLSFAELKDWGGPAAQGDSALTDANERI